MGDPYPGLWLALSPNRSTRLGMVKVEIRPGIWIRLTEEDARKRGFDVDAKPGNKSAKPSKTKAKAKIEAAPEPAHEPAAEPSEVVEAEISE